MSRKRHALLVVALLSGLFVILNLALQISPLTFAPLATLIERFWVTTQESPAVLVTVALWQLAILYTVPVGFWTYMVFVYLWHKYRPKFTSETDCIVEWAPEAIQVRIVTIDNEKLVQETVDTLPDNLTDVLVIAEAPMNIQGAEVVVVPAEFKCQWALYKGRAIEYARVHHVTDKEYVLYLDEDTHIPRFDGIPSNADIVQFRERPVRTGGLLPYLAEIHRIGFNIEQRAFPYLRVPFYAWGGGIAIRRTLEDKVTWDSATIVEDSVFTWKAVLQEGASFEVVDAFFENQAPPSVRAMINQRRRWVTGTRSKAAILPLDYRILYHFRDVGWAISVFAPLFWTTSALLYFGISEFPLRVLWFPEAYLGLSLALLVHVYLWSVLGLVYYRERPTIWVILLATSPFVVLVHSLGAVYGLLAPAKQFTVTKKILQTGRVVGETVPELVSDVDIDTKPTATGTVMEAPSWTMPTSTETRESEEKHEDDQGLDPITQQQLSPSLTTDPQDE